MQAEPKTSLVGEEYEVEVGPVAHGGHCIARTDEGQVLFVRHALPGERVVARVTEGEEGARFLRADAVEILDAVQGPRRGALPVRRPRPLRRLRLAARQARRPAPAQGRGHRRAAAAARRASPPRRPAGTARSMPAEGDKLPPGEVPAWRTRVQYAVDARRPRRPAQAPLARGRADRPLHDRRARASASWASRSATGRGMAVGRGDRRDRLQRPPGHPRPRGPGARLPLVELDKPVSVLRVEEHDGGVHRVHGRAFVRERADGRTYRVGSGGFWQVHPKAADTLVEAVMQGLLPRKGDMALDLYCGVGLFAGALADRVGEKGAVLGIESGKRAVEDARHNLADFDRVRIEQGKVEQVLPRTGITEADLIVLDPPRAGAGKQTVEHLAVPGRPPHRLRRLRPGGAGPRPGVLPGRRATGSRTLRAFDLFPMTHHVECVAILEPAAEGRLTCGFCRCALCALWALRAIS